MGGIRFSGLELHWGKHDCACCGGRGWVTAYEGMAAKIGNCAICCEPRTTNEEALLEERLSIIVHYHAEALMEEVELPADAVLH